MGISRAGKAEVRRATKKTLAKYGKKSSTTRKTGARKHREGRLTGKAEQARKAIKKRKQRRQEYLKNM